MPLNVYVISSNDPQAQKLRVEDYELVDVLGKTEDAFAVKIEELFSSVLEPVSKIVSQDSELTVEISGDVTLKAEGGAKWLFFNAGGSTSKTNSMKVTLKTKISPQKNSLVKQS
jgi:hypothetical protein